MAGRFSRKGVTQVGPTSAIVSTESAERTHELGKGYVRNAKGELFLLAASFMGGDSNFYEKEDDRYKRLLHLIGQEEVYKDVNWLYELVAWLRQEANLRTVAMVIALEAVRIRLAHEEYGDPTTAPRDGGTVANRDLVSVALHRADEPAEAVGYWLAKHGKTLPKPIKNGIADAAVRLYNEFSFIKYGESRTAGVTMKDVLRIVHPEPKDTQQNILFEYITSKDRDATLRLFSQRNVLNVLKTRKDLYKVEREFRRGVSSDTLKRGGITWEAYSEYIGEMDAEAWEKMIPNMGIMALIRNLRNFDEAGISQDAVSYVQAKIADAEEVAKSRQLPFRWYNAYRAVESVRWSHPLEQALGHSLKNIPVLDGTTLVLVDMSGSMFWSNMSPKSNVKYSDAAALFGASMKIRNPAGVHLWQYGSGLDVVPIKAGASVLRGMGYFRDMGGTMTHAALRAAYQGESRVILITDEQSWDNYDARGTGIPNNVPLYVWNLAGYRVGTVPTGSHKRHVFGGLSDSAFQLIPILEAGHNSTWPWEVKEYAGTS